MLTDLPPTPPQSHIVSIYTRIYILHFAQGKKRKITKNQKKRKKMESYKKTSILSVLLLVVVGMANAQMICNMSVASIMACKPSAVAPNPPPPSGTCCSALSHANITCLCSYKNSKLLPSLGIDPNLAMQLPQKCKLPHPSQC